MLSRLAKNQYEWRGISQIESSIQRMKSSEVDDSQLNPLKKRKKKKSLGILCESFIKQFLTWRKTISLEQAARRISDHKIDESKLKTKVRRLYDIANVLAALNLIEKTSLETRKPAFKWVGEEGLQFFIAEMEAYFQENSIQKDNDQTLNIPKANTFEFKSKSLNSTENPEVTKHFKRLNSASTSATFKLEAQGEEQEELTFGTPLATHSALNSKVTNCGLFTPNSSSVVAQLVELLDKLNFCQRKHPVYKPTPIYPINHFLANPCNVSSPLTFQDLRTTVLDQICEGFMEKFKKKCLNGGETQLKTPSFQKSPFERFGSSTTFESETQCLEAPRMDREKIGEDLKLQWSQMMKEFEFDSKKQMGVTSFFSSEQRRFKE